MPGAGSRPAAGRSRPRAPARALRGLAAALLLAAAGLFVAHGQAQAQSQKLVSNLGETFESTDSRVIGSSAGNQWSRSQAFTTGNGTSTIASVQIDIRDTSLSTYNPKVSIYTDASGSPGTSQATLNDPATLTDGVNTFTPASTLTLAANTTYHVVIESTSGSFGARYTDTDGEDSDGTAGWSIADSHDSRFADTGSWSSNSSELRIRIDGTFTANPNTAPTAANKRVRTAEDTAYTFAATDFGFMDADGDTLASVKITTLETDGDLELDDVDVELNDVITKADIDADKLTFTPDAGETGDPYATFGFSVNDGTVDSTSTYTMTIDVGAASTDATLSALALEDASDDSALTLDPAFAAATTSYNVYVDNAVDKVTVKPTVTDDGATFEILDSTDTEFTDADLVKDEVQVSVGVGLTEINVEVTAEDDSSTETYTVNVVRGAAAPTPDPDALWTANLTVGVNAAGITGFGEFGSTRIGKLAPVEFDVDSKTLRVALLTYTGGTSLTLFLSVVDTGATLGGNAYVLDLGGTRIDVPDPGSNLAINLTNPGLDWDLGEVVLVKLFKKNTPAEGTPAIEGTPQVGQMLTAGLGTIADADGLPTTTFPTGYTFQWVRVDGMTENDITGATSRTYTLTANDVGKTVKVKVSFTDGGGTGETRPSEAYPSTGTVRAAASACPAEYTWCGTMTVETSDETTASFRIEASGFRVSPNIGFLSPATFSHAGTPYTVTRILQSKATDLNTNTVTAHNLTLNVDGGGDLPDGTTLRVDGRSAALTVGTDSHHSTVGREAWNLLNVGSPPDWVDEQEVTVSLLFANTAPTAADNTVTTPEDTSYAFTAGDFGFSDVDGDTLASVKITTLETDGDLELDGVDVTENQVITRDKIDAGKLKFTPDAGESGDDYATFGFSVNDGEADSTSTYTMTVDVTAGANTPPTASAGSVTMDEDTTYAFSESDFGFMDADGDALHSVKIVATASLGDLELDGVDVTAGQVISKADIDDGKLTFTPAANANGPSYDTFSFRVSDGIDESSNRSLMTINVNPVNDAPTAANNTVTTGVDTAYAFTAADFGFSDVDRFDDLESVRIKAVETDGDLELDGAGVAVDQVIQRADIDAGDLIFTPHAGESGDPYATFRFMVGDGTADSASVYTMTVDVVDTSGDPVFDEGASATRSLPETLGDTPEASARNVGAPVTATDPQSDTLQYGLAGADAAKFDIDTGTGQIRTKAGERYDHEAANFAVEVTASDGTNSASIAVTIELTDRDEPPLAPGAPALTATADSSTSLDVSWAAPPNAGRPAIAAYDLSYRESGTGSWRDGPQGVTGTGATLGGLDTDTEYQVRVRARNDEGTGPYSAHGTGRTNPPPVPAVRFDRAAYAAVEGAGGAAVTVRIEPAAATQVTVRLRVTEEGGATAADWSGVPASLTFAAGETAKSFTVTAAEDAENDDGESILIEFEPLPAGVVAGSPASTRVSLVATSVTVWYLSFDRAGYTATEGGAGARVTARLNAPWKPRLGETLTVPLLAAGLGGADAGDWSGVPESVSFGPGATEASFTVTATDDAVDDDGESVELRYGRYEIADLELDPHAPSRTVVDLRDNDGLAPVTVSFAAQSHEAAEGGARAEVTVRLDRAPGRAVRIPLTHRGENGATFEDYSGVPGELLFGANDTEKRFTVTAVDDRTNDDLEYVTLGFGRLPDRVSAGAPSSAAVHLKDNDGRVPDVEVYFSGTSSPTPEGQSVAVYVYTDADKSERLSIPLTVERLGGAGPEDYMGVPANVTIPAGERRGHVAVMVLEDSEEGEEGEGIRLSFGDLPAGVRALPERSRFTITFLDNDGFPAVSASGGSVSEWTNPQSYLDFEVKLDHDAEYEVQVDYATAHGTAAAGQDYEPASGTLTFRPGQTSKTVRVKVCSDGVPEETENFRLRLSNGVRAEIKDGGEATGRIRDHRDPNATAAPCATGLVAEDAEGPEPAVPGSGPGRPVPGLEHLPVPGLASFRVRLNEPAPARVTVDYATFDRTATAGEDYEARSGTLTFEPGESSKTVDVTLLHDEHDEDGETFGLRLSNARGAYIGRGEATGAIEECCGGGTSRQTAAEPLTARFVDAPVSHDGVSAFTLRLSFSEDVEITPEDLRDHALSATGGAVTDVRRVDAAKDLFEVTVEPDGEGAVSVQLVPASSDCMDEGAVCTAAGTALTSLLLTSVRGPGPGLTVADAVATEGTDAALDFVVTLSPAAEETVTVAYRTTDGTATAPADYAAASGTLTFTPGETVKTVSVAIVDDGVEDSGETMTLTLSGATGAAIDDAEAIGTIDNTEALTASFSELPEAHDGSSAFTFELTFSEDVEGLSFRTLKFGGIEVSGGTVTKAKRHPPGVNRYWTIHVEPDGNGPVTVVLPQTTDCTADGAVCAPDGRMLSNGSRATVPGPGTNTVEPLTASFSSVPSEHDGETAFTLRVAFSEALPQGSKPQLRRALSVTGGSKSTILRVDGRLDLWEVKVAPSGPGKVTATLAPAGSCGDAAALCTSDGRALTGGPVTATVQGPPGLSVADAEADEAAEDAALAFVVTLDRAASGAVTVAYETSDGTAVAPADYTSTSGTLTFAAGEVEKTVSVPVVPDALDEGSETMTLTLSSPSGAYLADATATGTIANDGPIPQAWLARFGRTVADQVLGAVDARLRGARAPGIEAVVAGQRLSFDSSPGDADAVAAREEEARAQALGAWLRGEEGGEDRAALSQTRTVTARELFTGTSFSLTGGSAEGGTVSAWGRGTVSSFDGREGELALDGEVGNLMLGADFVRGRATAGLMLSHAQGSGGYRGASSGSIEASLTGLYPYGRWEASDRLSVWGVAGYGEGTLRVEPEEQAALETDMDLAMASVGVRGVLMKAPPEGGAELAIRSDAMAVRTTSEAVSTGAGNLAAAEADVTRLRLGLEGSRAFRFEDGASLTPSVELGVRHDGGDAETGFGADIGAGLAWSDPARGLSADMRARGLLTHEDGSFRERGFAGSLAWDPAPDSARGPSLSLIQTVGAQASGGVEALLGPQTAQALEAANDPGSGSGAGGDELERRALEAKLGYGFALFAGRYTGTPELSLGLTGTSRETVLGWRLAEETRTGLAFGLDVEAARQEHLRGDAAATHRLSLGFGWRLEGAGAGGFEVRFEGSRLEPANDPGSGSGAGAEHRAGVTLTARW